MDTQIYKISIPYKGEPEVTKMVIKKETPKTFVVSDGMMQHTIRKSELPFKWVYSNELITDDPVAGRKEWNRVMTLRAEEAEQKAKRYRGYLVKELD
jgi:hypothetical protein